MQGYAGAFDFALGLAFAFEVATAAVESAALASFNCFFSSAICALERCEKVQDVFVCLPFLNPMQCRTYGLLFLLPSAVLGDEDKPVTLVVSLSLPALGGAIDWKTAKPTILCSKMQLSPNLQGGVRRR